MPVLSLDKLVPDYVKRFEPYIPSKPDQELMKLYGCKRLYRLNNNENPLGPPAAALEALSLFQPTGAAVYHEQAVLEKGMAVVQVWLKLSWPWSGRVADALRERGYFLGGVLPRWFDTDGMMMQKIVGQPNWAEIKLYTARAKKLLELVQADWENVSNK